MPWTDWLGVQYQEAFKLDVEKVYMCLSLQDAYIFFTPSKFNYIREKSHLRGLSPVIVAIEVSLKLAPVLPVAYRVTGRN